MYLAQNTFDLLHLFLSSMNFGPLRNTVYTVNVTEKKGLIPQQSICNIQFIKLEIFLINKKNNFIYLQFF